MTAFPTERDPLIDKSNAKTTQPQKYPGPLEISKSNRYGILAAVWMATFLSVRESYLGPGSDL
jgi:hypothetical protein